MENALGEDLPVGIYRSNDKIKNLKIRVKVRKIGNACFTEKDPLVFGNPNELELVNMMKAPSAKAEKIFFWQEKVEENQQNKADDDKENERHKKDSLVIFLTSYTDSDILTKKWKNKSSTVPMLESSHLENQISKLKPKMRRQFQYTKTGQKPLFAGAKNLIKEKSSTNDTIQLGHTMIIMAIIHFDDGSPREEIQLCILQIDDHGTLTVIPDFTKHKSYIFLNSRSETFEYEIENVSPILKDSAIEREKYLIRKIAQYKKKIKAEKLGTEISQVPPEILIQINCEIVSAKNFSYPDIFIHYTIILPKGWNSESELEGVTETCRSKWKNGVNISYYGYLFSLTLKPNDDTQESDLEKESFKVIFEATSVDFWGNFRNEGYGYADIMLSPGMDVNDVYMWKLEPVTLKDKLQYFFIGGMPTLDDLSYVIKPKDIKDAQLSKYGLQTITSGSLEFQSSIIIQS